MAPLAVFGITNDGLNLAVNLLLLFLFVLWLALVYWTHADAKRRVSDPMLVGCATAAALFPFVGTIVYMVVRPPESLEDVHERALEIAAAEARLAHAHDARWQICPYCEAEVPGAAPKPRRRERPRRERPPDDAPVEPRRERKPAEPRTEVERPSTPPARQ